MVDCGANQNYASLRVAALLREHAYDKRYPYPVTMADGSPIDNGDGWIRREIRNVELTIDRHREQVTLDVAPIKYDVVLGMTWLAQHNPRIDWIHKGLEFPNCSHGTTGDGSSPKVPFRKAIWVRPRGRMLAGLDVALPSEYQDFEDLFREREGEAALPKHQPWDHKIPIKEGETLEYHANLIPHSKKEEDFLKEYIETHLEKKFIRPSESPIGHGVLFAPKKDGSIRPCIDYRRLNAKTIKNRYPLPRIDELQDRLLGATWFTAIDIRDAYYRVRMAEGEEWKTAFKTRWGLYEYQVMPFGLTNAPGTFQALINDTLREYLDDFVLAYLDDILIFSTSYDEHVRHVRKVLTKLREKDLPIKLSKCDFHKHSMPFLGFIVSENGLAPDPQKVESLKTWPEPTTVKEVQEFLGLANYYRKFVMSFSNLAAPMTNLTKKDHAFIWTQECKNAFKELIERLTAAPILAIFDPEREAVLETDASDYAIGACLTQKGADGNQRPIAYYSRKMTGPELNYDIHDKELLAVVEAFQHWRVYLEGAKFPVQVYTDHKNLLYWTTTKQLNRRQVRWSEVLASYDFQIHHVRGTENGRADALSRRIDYKEGTEPAAAALLKRQGDLLVFRGTQTIALMETELTTQQKKEIIQTRHDGRMSGHKGIEKTIELITRDFTWKGLRKDVTQYINRCDLCQKTKASRKQKHGQIQPIEPPEDAWSVITMDMIVKLPKSEEPVTKTKYDSILVIVDKLTKYSYMLPWNENATSEDLAYTIHKHIISQHGIPDEIISDRGTLFTSKFWQSLADHMGIKHKLSTSYHPQTDGQTERTNQTLEQYLRAYVNLQQNNWVTLLPSAQFAYNNSVCSTGVSPFFANYGKHPNDEALFKGLRPIAARAKIRVEKITEMHKTLQNKLRTINEKMRKYDKRTEGPDLKEGGKVYLLRKNIKTKRPNDKLDYVKLGPFEIKERLGNVTYKLDLPEDMRIHPVFHVSLLEPAPDNVPLVKSQKIAKDCEEPRYEIKQIHDARRKKGKWYFLVEWEGYPPEDSTWEPQDNFDDPELWKATLRRTRRT